MLILNNSGTLTRKTGLDLYSQASYAAPITVQCSVVHLLKKIKPTPVRADYSATRGAAEEEVSSSKILFPVSVAIAEEDKFTINNLDLRVSAVQLRYDVFGAPDHQEVDFEIWAR